MGEQFRSRCIPGKPNSKMNMVGDAANAIAFTIGIASNGGKICIQFRTHLGVKNGRAVFCAEDEMNQKEGERLWHGEDYRLGFQPSGSLLPLSWGFTPGWYRTHRWRYLTTLAVCCLLMFFSGCKNSAPSAAPPTSTQPQGSAYPTRPTTVPPAFKVFHQDNDTYTLVTKADASNDEVSALLWQFRDAAHTHTFDALHLSQKFIDARKPTVWFHVYRGARCASEKYTKGPLPCDASYHGAGDYTLGGYKNPAWDNGVLRVNGAETQLWDSDAPYTPPSPKPIP